MVVIERMPSAWGVILLQEFLHAVFSWRISGVLVGKALDHLEIMVGVGVRIGVEIDVRAQKNFFRGRTLQKRGSGGLIDTSIVHEYTGSGNEAERDDKVVEKCLHVYLFYVGMMSY